MDKLFIESLPLKGKKVLMRVDYNVPLDSDQHITDTTRIEASLPSVRYILDQGASLILMSHLGRPKNRPVANLSLRPCAQVLSSILEKEVKMAPDCVGYSTKKMVEDLQPGEVLMLENLRFHRAEEFPDEDPNFAKDLASYADYYINDAFGTAHRKHSSTYTIAQYFPQKAAAGYLLAKEIQFLRQFLENPKRPLCALIGGSKISSKIGILKALIHKVDTLIIAGGMSFTFLKANHIEIGDSLLEPDLVSFAKEILDLAAEKNVNLLLPIDLVIAKECSNHAPTSVVEVKKGIPRGYQGFDIGPQSIALFETALKKAKMILWNGPVGVYELDNFAHGSLKIAHIMSSCDAITIVGGGDSIAVINQAEIASKITHISTGGGATLEFIELGSLPGVDALSDAPLSSNLKSL